MRKKYRLEHDESPKKSHKKIPTIDIVLYVVGGLLIVGTAIALIVHFSKKPSSSPSGGAPGPTPTPGPGGDCSLTNCPAPAGYYCAPATTPNNIEYFGEDDTSGTGTCTPCPAGHYVTSPGNDCKPCPAETAGPTPGYLSPTCIPCPGAPAGSSKCPTPSPPPCDPGTSSKTGYSPCTPCAAGTYQPSKGETKCIKCTSCPDDEHMVTDCTSTKNNRMCCGSASRPCDKCPDSSLPGYPGKYGVCFTDEGTNTACANANGTSGGTLYTNTPCSSGGGAGDGGWGDCGNCMYGSYNDFFMGSKCCSYKQNVAQNEHFSAWKCLYKVNQDYQCGATVAQKGGYVA